MTTPQWELLPAHPLRFFGLKNDFQRKDLKRAYGRLIKQFKPETHPAEFQQIRKAYETLEAQNRYGMQQAKVEQASQAWDLQEPATTTSTGNRGPKIQVDVVNDIDAAVKDPKLTYKRLSKKSQRTPQDFFILATLCDLVDREDPNMYLKWLLTGIKEYPTDPGLQRLLTEFLSAFADAKIASSTLVTISKFVPGEDFYRITEKLWTRLADETEDFSVVAKTLAACDKNLKHRSIQPKLAFLVHFLRRAISKAPAKWVDNHLHLINQHGSELPADLENEIEFLQLISRYYQTDRSAFLNRPLGRSIDSMIEAYCQGSPDALHQVTTICDELARNGNGVMETFPYEPDELGERVLLLCHIIGGEVSFETGTDFDKVPEERIQMQADAVVSDIYKSLEEVGSRITWMRYRQFGPPFLVLLLGPIFLALGTSWGTLFLVCWIPFWILFFLAIVKPFWLNKRAEQKTERLILQAYQDTWRPRLFRYVQACHTPARESITQLFQSSQDFGQTGVMNMVLSYAFEDSAMQLFSRMQLFVR